MVVPLRMGMAHVLFANWPVDPGVIRPHLPDPLDVDVHDGRAWLSAVALLNVDVRPPWAPAAVGTSLPQLNLRTYVTHGDDDGVYFFSLDAQGILAGLGGRLLHHLPYYYARIDMEVADDRVTFESVRRHPGARPARFRVAYGPTGDPHHAEAGTLAAFLVERYRQYTQTTTGSLRYAGLDHDPWPLYTADAAIDETTLFRANQFEEPDDDPVLYYSPGVDAVLTRSLRPRAGHPSIGAR